MPIEIPRGLPFSVDTWSDASKRKRHHFLTHAHKDHLSGISDFFFFPIYCTRLTKTIVRFLFPQLDDSLFIEIELGVSVVIKDQHGNFSVRAFDANHCPGAVMFLFEGEFGNVLHTGDCRLNPECVQNLPLKYINKKGQDGELNYVFLDCTFGRCPIRIPNKQLAIQQVINCIWKHPNAPVVYLACDMLGQEDVLVQVSKAFGSKIYVNEVKNQECFNVLSLIAPEILSRDASSRFKVIEGFPRLNERAKKKIAEARASFLPEPLFIRPSTQWYATNEYHVSLSEAERDACGVWHVCYSMHSSQEELEWALQLLQPKWVISTTPPCRAMELDYVKKHCYKTRITHNDPIWKLFNGTIGTTTFSASTVLESVRNIDASVTKVSQASKEFSIADVKEMSIDHLEVKLDLSVQPSTIPITLFGRARLGEQYINNLHEEKRHRSESIKNTSVLSMHKVVDVRESLLNLGSLGAQIQEDSITDQALSLHNNAIVEPNIEKWKDVVNTQALEPTDEKECLIDIASAEVSDVTMPNYEYLKEDITSSENYISYIGSSKNINANLRMLYRSRNVPVPRSLPSLVELMSSIKRIKTGSADSF
ncbi:hypothetical protein KSP39_PZI023623 [Platanthera zijinensis]|uniref:DNA repair metallo-beta-lactamase domain-containing protein n=1 Tax=Platanthera zijinensis TaxID=2320716 RepID=A0AAP0ATD1_9ASPA